MIKIIKMITKILWIIAWFPMVVLILDLIIDCCIVPSIVFAVEFIKYFPDVPDFKQELLYFPIILLCCEGIINNNIYRGVR